MIDILQITYTSSPISSSRILISLVKGEASELIIAACRMISYLAMYILQDKLGESDLWNDE